MGLNSRVNAVLWSRSSAVIENIDVICFGHLLFEMCAGYELSSPTPTKTHLQLDLERYPQVKICESNQIGLVLIFSVPRICIIEFQVVEVLQMIFESPTGYPSLEELVLSDLFRNIDLREMRGSCVPVRLIKLLSIKSNNTNNQSILQSFKHSLSSSTMSLLNAVRKRHSTMHGSFSEGSSPCTPPSTPRQG